MSTIVGIDRDQFICDGGCSLHPSYFLFFLIDAAGTVHRIKKLQLLFKFFLIAFESRILH